MERFVRPVRYACRLLARSPLFTATAILSLSIGIGANTAIFTAANALLLAPTAGITEMERLVQVGRTVNGAGFDTVSYALYSDLQARVRVFENVYADRFEPLAMSLGADQGADRIYGEQVSATYFDTLGVTAAAGDFFHGPEERLGTPLRKVVLAHAFWTRRFNATASIVGSQIVLNGDTFTVVGVAAEGFQGTSLLKPDVWVPMTAYARGMVTDATLRGREYAMVVLGARLASGVTIDQAQQAVNAFMRTLSAEYPGTYDGRGLAVAPASRLPGEAGDFARPFIAILMGLVGLVLLVACANIGGLLLARAAARSREVALRLALGASRSSLIVLLATEALVLFSLGAVGALGVAQLMTRMLAASLTATPVPVELAFAFDWRVLLFTSAVALVAGLVTGLIPAVQSARADLVSDLKTDAGAKRRQRLRAVFVAAQMAICLVLIVTAGLLLRALDSAMRIDPGFSIDRIDVASVDLTLGGYDETNAVGAARDLQTRLAALPGIDAVAIAAMVPLEGGGLGLGGLRTPGAPRGIDVDVDWNVVSPEFATTLRLPIVQGRNFTDADRDGTPLVAIVNQRLAAIVWPGEDPIGRVLESGDFRPGRDNELRRLTVVGVAKDAKSRWLGEKQRAYIYVALAQNPWRNLHYFIRRSERLAPTSSLQPAVRRALRDFDRNLPLVQMMPFRQYADLGLLPQRVAAAVAGSLGTVALLLGAIGIYGICAFAVVSRTREIGIRVALGADARRVERLVLWQGLKLTAIGGAVGLVAALGLTQLLSDLLLGISPIDPIAFGGTLCTLVGVALAASYVPARRAARVNPVTALRAE
jgi:putative ABC transport system permease protein